MIERALTIPGATVHWYNKPGELLLVYLILCWCLGHLFQCWTWITLTLYINIYTIVMMMLLEMRRQRKMGHITIVGPSLSNIERNLDVMVEGKRIDDIAAG